MAGTTIADRGSSMSAGASPWSVKGISAEARKVAKTEAGRSGKAIGEWLTQVIRRTNDVENAERTGGGIVANDTALTPVDHGSGGASAALDGGHSAEQVERLARRVAQSEQRVVELIGPLVDAVDRIALRLEKLEARPELARSSGLIHRRRN
jgi:hypothetical protein